MLLNLKKVIQRKKFHSVKYLLFNRGINIRSKSRYKKVRIKTVRLKVSCEISGNLLQTKLNGPKFQSNKDNVHLRPESQKGVFRPGY